jgi:hypothetical protein
MLHCGIPRLSIAIAAEVPSLTDDFVAASGFINSSPETFAELETGIPDAPPKVCAKLPGFALLGLEGSDCCNTFGPELPVLIGSTSLTGAAGGGITCGGVSVGMTGSEAPAVSFFFCATPGERDFLSGRSGFALVWDLGSVGRASPFAGARVMSERKLAKENVGEPDGANKVEGLWLLVAAGVGEIAGKGIRLENSEAVQTPIPFPEVFRGT